MFAEVARLVPPAFSSGNGGACVPLTAHDSARANYDMCAHLCRIHVCAYTMSCMS